MPAQHFSLCMKQAVSNSHFGKRVEINRNSSRQSNKSVEMNERKKKRKEIKLKSSTVDVSMITSSKKINQRKKISISFNPR